MPNIDENSGNTTFRKPKRYFEKSGVVNPETSFYVPLKNITNPDKLDIKAMIDLGKYFSIFAPRQSGKTTYLEEIRSRLHEDNYYAVIILSFERYKTLDKKDFYHHVQKVHEETGGQPWLVNRLGTILTVDIKPGTIEAVDEADVEEANNILLKERNSHFDNLLEKARLYKETFVEIVFDHTEYDPDNDDQTWLEQYGLIKNRHGKAVVANNIYKARYLKAFFRDADVDGHVYRHEYELPGNILDMKRILLDFETYIARIGVNAFYEKKKPYEKTGQFLLTAWLYQFVKGGVGELRYEARSGLGRMDITLSYKGKNYIIETKVNRYNTLNRTINEGAMQLTNKYPASEKAEEGFLVVFDIKTPIGTHCEPRNHLLDGKRVTSFTIGIERSS